MSLDERTLRKAEFSEGYKVKLADGQEWTFPKPRLRFRPWIDLDGRVKVSGGPSFGPEYDGSLDVLFGVVEAEPIERLRVKFEMAVRLLQANYELTAAALAELLVLEPGDEGSNTCWDQLTSAIMGIGPKRSPVI